MTRFRVVAVGEIVRRGRCVIGDVVEGKVKVGSLLHLEHAASPAWRVSGVEFADSPSVGEYHMGLILENAPPLEDLRRLLPQGSLLVAD